MATDDASHIKCRVFNDLRQCRAANGTFWGTQPPADGQAWQLCRNLSPTRHWFVVRAIGRPRKFCTDECCVDWTNLVFGSRRASQYRARQARDEGRNGKMTRRAFVVAVGQLVVRLSYAGRFRSPTFLDLRPKARDERDEQSRHAVMEVERLLWREGPQDAGVRGWIRRRIAEIVNGLSKEPTESLIERQCLSNLCTILSQVGIEARPGLVSQELGKLIWWAKAVARYSDDHINKAAAFLRLGFVYNTGRMNVEADNAFGQALEILNAKGVRRSNEPEELEVLALSQAWYLREHVNRSVAADFERLGSDLPHLRHEFLREMVGLCRRGGRLKQAESYGEKLLDSNPLLPSYEGIRDEKGIVLQLFAAGKRDLAIARIEREFTLAFHQNPQGFYRDDVLGWSRHYRFTVPDLPSAEFDYFSPFLPSLPPARINC